MQTLCIILARAGSKGLPGKNTVDLLGRPLIAYTIDHAMAATSLDRTVVSTDGTLIAQAAHQLGVEVVGRPPHLANDVATVDGAARHATETCEAEGDTRYDAIVILYGNIPLRPAGLVDQASEKLSATGADSVQSVCAVGKMHPFWMKKVGGDGQSDDALGMYEDNAVYRRQDLPPVYMLDGGVIAVTRDSLFTNDEGQPHAFLGADRRAIITEPGQVVDVDTDLDLMLAEALLRRDEHTQRHIA